MPNQPTAGETNPPKQKKNPTNELKEEMVFSVMPRTDDTVLSDGSTLNTLTNTPNNNSPEHSSGSLSDNSEVGHQSIWHNKVTYIVMGILLVSVLAGLAYFLLGSGLSKDNNGQPANSTKLPTVFLKRYFNVDVCQEITKCGDTSDPENDGLSNYDEFREQTDPTKNDSDGDGLADGDEVNIYGTDPRSKYTDSRPISEQNDYNDGSQIRNEYDPLTPGLKMTEIRKQQILTNIEKYKLHTPSIETLDTSVPAPKTVNVSIANNKFVENSIEINVNDTVTWTNKDSVSHQIASDPHPTHTGLTGLESGILATNQTFSYKFTKIGSYNYHDHRNPEIKGTVTVK